MGGWLGFNQPMMKICETEPESYSTTHFDIFPHISAFFLTIAPQPTAFPLLVVNFPVHGPRGKIFPLWVDARSRSTTQLSSAVPFPDHNDDTSTTTATTSSDGGGDKSDDSGDEDTDDSGDGDTDDSRYAPQGDIAHHSAVRCGAVLCSAVQ